MGKIKAMSVMKLACLFFYMADASSLSIGEYQQMDLQVIIFTWLELYFIKLINF